jgi:hypothetical protein
VATCVSGCGVCTGWWAACTLESPENNERIYSYNPKTCIYWQVKVINLSRDEHELEEGFDLLQDRRRRSSCIVSSNKHRNIFFPADMIAFLVNITMLRSIAEILMKNWHANYDTHTLSLSLSLSNGATARGGPRPPSRVSSIPPDLGRPLSSFYIPALPHPPPLHLPKAAWVSLWGVFLLARWGWLSWIIHRHPGLWHVLPISVYSACRISQCNSHKLRH